METDGEGPAVRFPRTHPCSPLPLRVAAPGDALLSKMTVAAVRTQQPCDWATGGFDSRLPSALSGWSISHSPLPLVCFRLAGASCHVEGSREGVNSTQRTAACPRPLGETGGPLSRSPEGTTRGWNSYGLRDALRGRLSSAAPETEDYQCVLFKM